MMRLMMLAGLLLWQASGQQPGQAPIARREDMRYMRAVKLANGAGQACAVLDAAMFPHAAPSLKDLRLFPETPAAHELPYAITMSEPVTQETDAARVLNLGREGTGRIAFDLAMPRRAYTSVLLQLDPMVHDFIATATVTGSDSLGAGRDTRALGTFTLFDLESQHLSRNTTLPLEESTFPYLHIVLSLAHVPAGRDAQKMPGPSLVRGAQIPPSRESQIIYTPVAETSNIATVGRESRATFQTPARVPVERVTFILAPGFSGNFSRDVRVTAKAESAARGDVGPDQDARYVYPETIRGNILRVHANEAGHEIRTEQLSLPAVLGANLQRGAKVEVAVENGDDQPLPIAGVRLEMRQRKLCFQANAGAALALYYGDDRLEAPLYDYASLFTPSRTPVAAELGPEQANPMYRPGADARPFTERHPETVWIALLVVICVLGAVAVRASKNVGL
jgi:hypothetical protein